MSAEFTPKYMLQSKTDNQIFEVSQNVIDASEMLKNVCEFTEVSEPIILDCSGESLSVFIKVVNNHSEISEKKILPVEILSNSLNEEQFPRIIQELSILDSDLFLNFAADFILKKMENMNTEEIREYLGMEEDDFSADERIFIRENRLQYFIGMDFDGIKFPFPNKPLYSLKTKFSSPLNALLARIIKRSDATISYQMSFTNKAIKNEINRNPLKTTEFHGGSVWIFKIRLPRFFLTETSVWLQFKLRYCDEKFDAIIKKIQLILKKCCLWYESMGFPCTYLYRCSSMDWVIPLKNSEIRIAARMDRQNLECFDAKTCPFSSIFYILATIKSAHDRNVSFEEMFDLLIARDLSKKIRIHFGDFSEYLCISDLAKNANASQFYRIDILKQIPDWEMMHKIYNFVNKYLEEDGIVVSRFQIPEILEDSSGKNNLLAMEYKYSVSKFKKFVENIASTM